MPDPPRFIDDRSRRMLDRSRRMPDPPRFMADRSRRMLDETPSPRHEHARSGAIPGFVRSLSLFFRKVPPSGTLSFEAMEGGAWCTASRLALPKERDKS
jgi:hypothetical protein